LWRVSRGTVRLLLVGRISWLRIAIDDYNEESAGTIVLLGACSGSERSSEKYLEIAQARLGRRHLAFVLSLVPWTS